MTVEPPRIAYVGPFYFPEGGAASRRILGNALSFQDAGFEVLIGSGQLDDGGGPFDHHGLAVHSLNERVAEDLPVWLRHLRYTSMGRHTRHWLEGLRPRPSAVVLYSDHAPYFMQIGSWCSRHGIPLIYEAVEWYEVANLPGGAYSPYRVSFELAFRFFAPRCGNVISISTYLAEHFRGKGCRPLVVPPTLDTTAVEARLEAGLEPHLAIGYAGTPGQKDMLDSLLEAVIQVDPTGDRLRFRLAGVSEIELRQYPAIASRWSGSLPPCIEALGRVPQAQAIALIGRSDFSVLLRRPERFAQAGFPTKVVESMAMGTPVICNLTSDLGQYVHHGVEGLVCKDHQVPSLVQELERALAMSVTERSAMRQAAQARAVASFDYRRYSSPLKDFMDALIKPDPHRPASE